MFSFDKISEIGFHFIKDNLTSNIYDLSLKRNSEFSIDEYKFLVLQVECRQKSKKKLSELLSHEEFLFPTLISSEQSTNQEVAKYHARLAGTDKNIIDMTGGLGVDSIYLSLENNSIITIEKDTDKANILKYNLHNLEINNINVVNGDSIEYLKSHQNIKSDIIFIDPARRDSKNNRKYCFEDCEPDIIENFDLIFSRCQTLMIKCSPMLDIKEVIRKIPQLDELHLVNINGECKEILLICRNKFNDYRSQNNLKSDLNKKITVVDIKSENIAEHSPGLNLTNIKFLSKWECFSSEFGKIHESADINLVKPGSYIYDLNSGLHKLNVSKKLCSEFKGLKKLSDNTELYWSTEKYDNFPGRIFKIVSLPDKKMTKSLKNKYRNLITRNYNLSPDILGKKIGIKQGGTMNFLIGTKIGINEKPVIIDCVQILD